MSMTLSIPNLHVVIVDHVGKMVGGESVRLHDDRVPLQQEYVVIHWPVDQVLCVFHLST